MGLYAYGMSGYGNAYGPMIYYPRTRTGRGKAELKGSLGKMWAYLRDYPSLSTKMWKGKARKDSSTAANLQRKVGRLMKVVGGSKPPLAQILEPQQTAVIGYVDDNGRAVPAPLLPVVQEIPVVRSNNQRKYVHLYRNAIDFATEYAYMQSHYSSKKRE